MNSAHSHQRSNTAQWQKMLRRTYISFDRYWLLRMDNTNVVILSAKHLKHQKLLYYNYHSDHF